MKFLSRLFTVAKRRIRLKQCIPDAPFLFDVPERLIWTLSDVFTESCKITSGVSDLRGVPGALCLGPM